LSKTNKNKDLLKKLHKSVDYEDKDDFLKDIYKMRKEKKYK